MEYNELDESFVEMSNTETVAAEPNKTYNCNVCAKVFMHKYSLKRHSRTHGPEMPSCPICHQYFKNEVDKLAHNTKYHATKLLCNECGKELQSKATLARHMATAHNDVEGRAVSYKCPFDGCGKAFLSKIRFGFHVNNHTGQKPYTCSNCHRAFQSCYKKTQHEKLCTNEKEIKCGICNVKFTDSQSLRRHDNSTHKGIFQICQCGKQYTQLSSLRRHRIKQNH